MTDQLTNDEFSQRVQALITNALCGLDPQDREERIAYCREHDEHGVRVFTDPDGVLEFRWGGRTLAMVSGEDLGSSDPLDIVFQAADCPDTVPDDLL